MPGWHATLPIRGMPSGGFVKTGICLFAALTMLSSTSIRAADLTVSLDDGRGGLVADAVVTVEGSDTPARTTKSVRQPAYRTIDQKNLAFVPYLEILRPGDSVVFRNSDRTRHHVYSFSPVRQFEFVLAPGESSQPQRLDKSGIVAVGCNIHDQMIAYLYISDAQWIARSAVDGRLRFHDLPAGAYRIHVWHPRMRPGKSEVRSITLAAADSRTLNVPMSLLPDATHHFDRERSGY
jgi:plastocyanin